VIDISHPDEKTGERLVSAAAEHGFIYIKSTGLGFPKDTVDNGFKMAREFFASPTEEKEICIMTKDNRGWTKIHGESSDPSQKLGDFKEAFNFGEFKKGKAQQALSPVWQAHEAELDEFGTRCRLLCLQLLNLLASGLKIEDSAGGADWFSSRHDPKNGPSGTILRFLHYPTPTTPPQSTDIRAGAHSDFGTVTLLFRLPFQPGLEILTADNTWAPVPVTPPGTENDPFPPILINIGDLLSYWTGGLLRSTVHRVTFPTDKVETRYSIAYFFHPCRDTELVPIPSEIVKQYIEKGGKKIAVGEYGYGYGVGDKRGQTTTPGAAGKTMTAAEHLTGRLSAAYGWDREEIKVH